MGDQFGQDLFLGTHERPQTGKQRDDLFKSGVCRKASPKVCKIESHGCTTVRRNKNYMTDLLL